MSLHLLLGVLYLPMKYALPGRIFRCLFLMQDNLQIPRNLQTMQGC
jgi:hypothetical protein